MAADIHCRYNDLDLSPETDSGRGAVDFKFSKGSRRKVLVELKLSANGKLVDGYRKQIKAYIEAERPQYAFYVVLDDGKHVSKIRQLLKVARRVADHEDLPELIIITGTAQPSASRL